MRFLIRILVALVLMLPVSVPLRAEACSNAPMPRLEVGMSGEVMPGLRGLRLRALPTVGAGMVLSLNGGTAFTVIAGPSCNGGYNWWRVELINGTRGWLAEGTWTQYYLTPVRETIGLCDLVQTPWIYGLTCRLCGWLTESKRGAVLRPFL